MCRLSSTLVALLGVALGGAAAADELLVAYEGDVFPYDADPPWLIGHECIEECQEFILDSHHTIDWRSAGHAFSNFLVYAMPPILPPETLWVEWNFRSNHPLGPSFCGCDAWFTLKYRAALDRVDMYGDAAIRFGCDTIVLGLSIHEFHTFRFESLDGTNYRISVDGLVFVVDYSNNDNGTSYLQMGGYGGCNGDQVPDARNEWDFIRYGTIGFGERIVESDPPMGFLDPGSPQNLVLDRFAVTYDSPAYAYIDDIAVGVTCDAGPPCPTAPQVIATKRLDNGPPDVLEIVFDRPLPPAERTTFTFTDVDPSDPEHPTVSTVAYTFQRGDVNADGQWNLLDFASLQNCYFTLATSNACAAFDYDTSIFVDATDYAPFAFDFVDHGP